jgi:sortase B
VAEIQIPSELKKANPIPPSAPAEKTQKRVRRALRDVKKEPVAKMAPAPEVKTEPVAKTAPIPEVKKELEPKKLPEFKRKAESAPPLKKAEFRLKGKAAQSGSKAAKVPLQSAPLPENPEKRAMSEMVKKSLDGMYEVYEDPAKAKKNSLSRSDLIRYGILFVCIFGFLFEGAFVFTKLYDYYRVWAVNTKLQEMVSKKDYFQEEYLKKTSTNIISLTPQDILSGKTEQDGNESTTFSEEQQNLVGKITQLKAINPDTAGWITIEGTVVNYPVVWSETKNYYLRRDFYKKVLSGGTLFIDERNSSLIEENRNTVIYGHNMTDGSMFASLHDFASSSVFYSATIQIATENGIFIYEPFSAHESNAYDNYFETNFVSDEDFINFCEQMQFISLFQTDHAFDKNSQIITLSTCASGSSNKDDRFAVHAVLTRVIR